MTEIWNPWKPAKYCAADVAALQALARGEADDFQQKRALKWIIEDAACVNEEQYIPTTEKNDGRRDTDYALGMRKVGQQIVKLLKLDLQKVKDQEEKPFLNNTRKRP